jgi:glycosyltransferase involved in cell wall biosynthesis
MPYRDGASYRHGTLMAALAHGMPIVTTVASRQSPVASSTLPQLCNGENCLMVEPNNPRALADAIHRAVVLPELRNRIGAGARELAQYFTWDKIAQKHLALYQQLLT